MPESGTLCGLPAALSIIVSEAFLAPVVAGPKVTLTVQEVPTVTLVPQLFVSEKSLAFGPAIPMPEMASGPVPVLLRVTVRGVPVVPTN